MSLTARRIRHPLHLSPFTLDEFENAIRHNLYDPPCPMLGEIHSTLVYVLRTVTSQKDTSALSFERESRADEPVLGVSLDQLRETLDETGNNWERVPLRTSEGREGWEEAMIGCLRCVSPLPFPAAVIISDLVSLLARDF